MLKRILCTFLFLCTLMQSLPLTTFAQTIENTVQEEATHTVAPEAFSITEFDIEEGIVTVLSPEKRADGHSALVLVAQYKNGVTIRTNIVEAELSIGKNTIAIPDYIKDDSATVKVMLWDSIDTLRPLCDSLEIGAKTLDVNFVTGIDGMTVSKRTYPSNVSFGKLPTPLANDRLFVGWYYDTDYTSPVLEDDLVVDNCTLYAKMVSLSSLYDDSNTIFAERYVANIDASPNTNILIISDDINMSADDVLESITAENLSVMDSTESYTVERYTIKAYKKDLDSPTIGAYKEPSYWETQQNDWLVKAEEDTVFFVFSAEGGFTEGNSYRITLDNGQLSFAGHAETAREYNLSVRRDAMSNLKLRDDIIFVDEALVNDNDHSEVQLYGVTINGNSEKSKNTFSLGSGISGEKLIISNKGGTREIISVKENTTLPNGTIIIGDPGSFKELNNSTVAVYSQNDSGDEASLLTVENLLLPEELTLDGSALWNMDYRTIKGQSDVGYIYTDTNSKNILFKPDIFPMLESAVNETETQLTIPKADIESISPDTEITISATGESVKYSDFGITNDTTMDVGDFIVFLKDEADENDGPVHRYVKIIDINESEDNTDNCVITYMDASEEDILTSMDLYGERDLSAKELTGLDDFTEIEEQAKLQALNSGFANNTAMYVSSVMIASEAFADLSEEFDINFEEIRDELTNSMNFDEIELFESDNIIYKSKDGVLIVKKPDVESEIATEFEVNGKIVGGVQLTLEISGEILINVDEKTKSTITISYSTKFTQTLRAEIVMTAKADIHYILWIIPVIDDCTVSANVDFYTTSDAHFTITAGLTSESAGNSTTSKKVWYAPTSGERYHLDGCTYETTDIKYVSLEKANTIIKDGKALTPCLDCNPENSSAAKVWYATISGERYHLDSCSHKHQYIKFISIEQARNLTGKSGNKLLPCERCQPEEKVYVTPFGECYHRKNCSYLNESNESGTIIACTIPVIKESGNHRPCSRCCPGELLADGLTSELTGLLDKVSGISDTVTNAVEQVEDFQAKLEEARAMLGGVAPEKAEDADAAVEEESIPVSLVAEKKLIERYQTLMSNSYSDWAEIYRLNLFSATVFSFYGIINVSVSMDFCLYANLNLALESDLHYENAKRYIFTIKPFTGEVKQDIQELVPEQFQFDFMAMGTAGLKLGVELGIGVNFISDSIGNISVTGEVGLYIKLWGYFNYHFKRVTPKDDVAETTSKCHGALYLEAGPYIDVGFSASLFNDTEWNPSLYYEEFPIITVGERNAVIGFADESDDTQYRLRRDYKSLKLPNDLISVVYLDLRTGKTGTEAKLDDLTIAKQVSDAPLTYVSKNYTIVINNDGNDKVFSFDPETTSIVVTPDDDPEEAAELIITYNLPASAFNRTAITKKVQLYWDTYGEEHTIVLDSNGGNYVAPIIEASGKAIQLPTPVRPGYIFNGWTKTPNGDDFCTFTTMPNNDIVLYAKWNPGMTTYTVNHWQYDLKGIPQLYEPEIVKALTEDDVTPERKEYTGFKESSYKETAKVKGDGSTVIDYYYEREDYLYELNVGNQVSRRKVLYGTPIVLTGREIPGYTFNGWKDNSTNKIFDLWANKGDSDVLAFNFGAGDLKLTADIVAKETTPYRIELYTYHGVDDMNAAIIAQRGTLDCTGVTDTLVDFTPDSSKLYDNPDAFELVNIDKEYTGKLNLQYDEDFSNIEDWDYIKYDNELNSGAKGTIDGNGLLVLRIYYKKAKRTIEYDIHNYGNIPLTADVNASIPRPETNPSKTGYTFGGWEYGYMDDETFAPVYRAEYNEEESKWKFYNIEKSAYCDDILMPREVYVTEAIWIPNTYTITLEGYDSVEATSVEATYGEALPEIAVPSREGYTFGGYLDASGKKYYNADGKAVVQNYEHDKNITLTPKWTANSYRIEYRLNDEKSVSKANNDNAESYTVQSHFTFKHPTRAGYTFEGWYTAEDFADGSKIESTDGYNGDLNVYAKWTIKKYAIEYTLYTPEGTDTWTTSYTIEDKVTYERPTREYYYLDGWYDKDGMPTTDGFEAGTTIDDKKLYAHLKAINYSIEYDLNDEESVSKASNHNANSYTVESHFTFEHPTRAGYTFEGWYTTEDFADGSKIESTEGYNGKLTVYAKWNVLDADDFAITYLDNGEMAPDRKNPNEYTIETTEWTLYAPTRTGYTFNEWIPETPGVNVVKQPDGTWKATDTRTLESKLEPGSRIIVFRADWIANQYDVLYDVLYDVPPSSNISFVGDTPAINTDENYYTNATYAEGFTLPTPVLPGYTFGGWLFNNTLVGAGGTVVKNLATDGNITLYAKWTANTYTVIYNLPKPISFKDDIPAVNKDGYYYTNATYDKSFTLPTPVLPGYTFGGWYSDSSYVGKSDESVTNLVVEGKIILYPDFKPITYNVTFDLNKPDNAKEDVQFVNVKPDWTYDEECTITDPTLTGWTFTGWTITGMDKTNHIIGDEIINAEELSVVKSTDKSTAFKNLRATDGEVTFTANWELNDYKVTWTTPNHAYIKVTVNDDPNLIISGATVHYGDVINIEYQAYDGFHFDDNGTKTTTITESITVEENDVTIDKIDATVNSYTVIWDDIANGTITVTRTKSPYANASCDTPLGKADENKDTVYYGDVLRITYKAKAGFHFDYDNTKNTITESITVKENLAIEKKNATVNSYTVTWDDIANGTITVTRTESPYTNASCDKPLGKADENKDTVYYGDVLKITYTPYTGFNIGNYGETSIPVTGDVTSKQIWAFADPITYNITYNCNGGIISGEYSRSYTVLSKAITIPTPTYSTYPQYNYFVGWYEDMELSKPFNNDLSTIKENPKHITLYAKWDLCTVYNSIDSTPFTIQAKRVIIDWSKEYDTNLLNHTKRQVNSGRYNNVDICNPTQEVIFIGDSSKTYKNFCMHFCSYAKDQKLKLHFDNFKFISNESAAIGVWNDSGVDLTIVTTGESSIAGCNDIGGAAIDLGISKNNLTFDGNGILSISAGNGSNATSAGVAGGNGGVAVKAKNIHMNMTGTLNLTGGNGGNGAQGSKGSIGDPSYSGHDDRNATGGGANGGTGDIGGTGGNGGKGGYAYCVSRLVINSGTLIATGGKSGDGGKGGTGGTGGKGQEAGGWGTTAGNGGKGGTGGTGGDTYKVDASDGSETITINRGTLSRVKGASGTVGPAGDPGLGGEKGMHCDNDNCGQWLTGGNDGKPGDPGDPGQPGSIVDIP